MRLWLIQVLIARDRLEEAAPVIEEGLAAAEQPPVRPGPADGLGGVGAAARRPRGRRTSRPQAEQAVRAASEAGDRFARTVALMTRPRRPTGGAGSRRRSNWPNWPWPSTPGSGRRASTSRSTSSRPDSSSTPAGRPRDTPRSSGPSPTATSGAPAGNCPTATASPALGWFLTGRWDDALVELEAADALAEELGTRRGTAQGYAITAFIALHRSDFPGAAAALDRRRPGAGRRPAAGHGATGRRGSAPWSGRGVGQRRTGVRSLIWDAWQECALAGVASGFPLLAPDVVRLCLRTGDRARAESAAVDARGAGAPGRGSRAVSAAALRCRGSLERTRRASARRAALTRTPAAPFDGVRAAEEAGGVLAESG